MLCCSCAIYFSAAASSENDQGSMNLPSKTGPSGLNPTALFPPQPYKGGLVVAHDDPGIGLVPARFSSSVARPSWTMRLPERSSASTSPPQIPGKIADRRNFVGGSDARVHCHSRYPLSLKLRYFPRWIRASTP
jgi:hypothetical protein